MRKITVPLILSLMVIFAVSVNAVRIDKPLTDYPPAFMLSLDGVNPPDNGSKDAVKLDDESFEDEADEDEPSEKDSSSEESTFDDELPDEPEDSSDEENGLPLDGEMVQGDEIESVSAEDVRMIRLYMEVGLFALVPFFVAVLMLFLICLWFYKTFIR